MTPGPRFFSFVENILDPDACSIAAAFFFHRSSVVLWILNLLATSFCRAVSASAITYVNTVHKAVYMCHDETPTLSYTGFVGRLPRALCDWSGRGRESSRRKTLNEPTSFVGWLRSIGADLPPSTMLIFYRFLQVFLQRCNYFVLSGTVCCD